MTEQDDKREVRCRRLGHEVTFRYCRTLEGETVCPEILNCWWQQFDVERLLRQHLSAEQLARLATPERTPKVVSILQIVAEARKQAQDS